MKILYNDCDNILKVLDVRDSDGVVQTDATIKITMKKLDGSAITEITDLAFTYIPTSQCDYKAMVANTFHVDESSEYVAILEVTSASGRKVKGPVEVSVQKWQPGT